jgi:hypothetical protein
LIEDILGDIEESKQVYILYPTSFQMNAVMVHVDPTDALTQGGSNWNPETNSPHPVHMYLKYLEGRMQNACKPYPDLNWLPKAQIGAIVTSMQIDSGIPDCYQDKLDVFSEELARILPQNSEHDHAINLEDGKTLPQMPIYNLLQRELEILRAYLDSSLKKGWIRPSKLSAGAPILFVPKADGTMRLCVNYRGLNRATSRTDTLELF